MFNRGYITYSDYHLRGGGSIIVYDFFRVGRIKSLQLLLKWGDKRFITFLSRGNIYIRYCYFRLREEIKNSDLQSRDEIDMFFSLVR